MRYKGIDCLMAGSQRKSFKGIIKSSNIFNNTKTIIKIILNANFYHYLF